MAHKNISFDIENNKTQNWQVIYTGFILIILCFFIMMCSYSVLESERVTRFVRSFRSAVGVLPGGVKFEEGKVVLPESTDLIPPEHPFSSLSEDVQAVLRQYDTENQVDILPVEASLMLRFPDSSLFETGKSEIIPESVAMLIQLGKILQDSGLHIGIEGHTDNVPIHTQRFPSNWELSAARAVNVLRFLIDRFNIPPGRISALGYSEFRPIYPNDSEVHRALNRRIEIRLTKMEQFEVEGQMPKDFSR